MPAPEKSFRSFGHQLGSSYRERDERIGQEGGKKRTRKVAPLHGRKSREIKASNFLRIVRRISRRTSSLLFLSPRRPTGVARKERARRAGSCFSRPDTRCQMQSVKREMPRIARVEGIGWLAVAERREERRRRRCSEKVDFRLYSDPTWHFNYLYRAINSTMKSPRYVSLVSAFVLRLLTNIPLICFYSLWILV